jgi:hypothetical protein
MEVYLVFRPKMVVQVVVVDMTEYLILGQEELEIHHQLRHHKVTMVEQVGPKAPLVLVVAVVAQDRQVPMRHQIQEVTEVLEQHHQYQEHQ